MRTLMPCLVLTLLMLATDDASANCRSYTPRLGYSGKLGVGESKLVTEWRSPCPGSINASAAKGRLTLMALRNGEWQKVKEGISTIVPTAPAGTYRLVVTNPYGIPFGYAVGLSYGRG